ncbi:transcriptional regulator [Rhizomicrobium sp. SCGC AG-212-E05]|nr:transcriptional regulator [Rhizomicrobium sp. SCGC AG-212-E05]
MKNQPQKPTQSELEILHVLWSKGPSTVREVLEALNETKDTGYTGVLKLLQIMTAKGTVRRDESQRAHVYEAFRPAEQTKRQLATDMLQRVFEGSASQLMMHALAGHRASREEIEEIRRILDAYKSEKHGKGEKDGKSK